MRVWLKKLEGFLMGHFVGYKWDEKKKNNHRTTMLAWNQWPVL
jgi:hypothetical protein